MKIEKILPGTLHAESYQMSAIIKGINLGKEIMQDIPDIADLYRKNISVKRIVDMLSLVLKYNTSQKICESAVYHALKGYNGGMNSIAGKTEIYSGLLNIKELKTIARCNNSISGKLIGIKMFHHQEGIFAMSPSERKFASEKGAINRGFIIYSEQEIEMIKKLVSNKKYFHFSGNNYGTLKMSEISVEVNKKIHKGKAIRNARSIAKMIKRKGLLKKE